MFDKCLHAPPSLGKLNSGTTAQMPGSVRESREVTSSKSVPHLSDLRGAGVAGYWFPQASADRNGTKLSPQKI